MLNFNDYDCIIHRHRFAAWAASRAAQRSHAGFDVPAGKQMIEEALFGGGEFFNLNTHHNIRKREWNDVWNNLPNNYDGFITPVPLRSATLPPVCP